MRSQGFVGAGANGIKGDPGPLAMEQDLRKMRISTRIETRNKREVLRTEEEKRVRRGLGVRKVKGKIE